MNAAPSVSVIVPVRDGERYLAEALDSALSQGWPGLEVVVVDDGSHDGTAAIAAGYGERVRFERVAHGGAAAARNRAVALASGELLAFLDADDVWIPGRLARLVDALLRAPTAGAACGHVVNFASPDLAAADIARLRLSDAPLAGDIPSATVVRRAAFDHVGPFRADAGHLDWPEWSIRARQRGLERVLIPDVVTRRRIHAANAGRAAEDPQRAWLALVRRHLHAGRLAGG